MSFLRRVLGGGSGRGSGEGGSREDLAPVDPVADNVEDAARDAELLAEDARRLSDDLLARQLRYADRAWTPPAQGGALRAGDDQRGGKGQG
jgi:hypothetical protein